MNILIQALEQSRQRFLDDDVEGAVITIVTSRTVLESVAVTDLDDHAVRVDLVVESGARGQRKVACTDEHHYIALDHIIQASPTPGDFIRLGAAEQVKSRID